MGKRNGPPSDRVQAGRIEKQRRDAARSKLPAWYLRLSSQQYTKYRSVSPEDFDEDISELGESDKSSEMEDDAECECDSDASECDCGFEDEKDEDNESEKTCEGSEAEFYYEMKDCRRERKKSLLEERKREEEAKESAMDYAKAKEEEVNTAYTAFKKTQRRVQKKGEKIPLDFDLSHRGGITYKLFSTQHVEWLFGSSIYPTQRADFHYLDECDGVPRPKDGEERPMFGMIYLDAMATCNYGPIAVPTQARRKTVRITGGKKYELKFKFFKKKYLKLSVPRAVVEEGTKLPPDAPETFEFVGILRDLEKEKEERLRAAEEEKKNRPASPRESYFEMNHPMGWWAQSRW